MKALKRIRFIKNGGLQLYIVYVTLFINELSSQLTIWEANDLLKALSDILCDCTVSFFQVKKPIAGYLDSFHLNAKLTFLLNWKFTYVDVIVKYNRIYIIHSLRIMKIIGIFRCVLSSFNPKHRHLITVYRGAPLSPVDL